MRLSVFILQIGELFKGNFNREGVFHLVLFLLMGGLIVGLAVFLGYKAFKPKK
ncbi:MAG TPA: hypothetical protein VIL74_24160 [Pyrinomonadaceae bacterium]|jgi:hypothetical protein